jgi:hypothetical protein
MFKTTIDARAFVKDMSDIEKRQFPFACMQTLNDAAFAVRDAWENNIPQVFDRPTEFTRKAVRYIKATKQTLTAEVFLRNEAAGGTPPSRYLEEEVRGGQRRAKPFELLLRRAGVLGANEFVVPGRGIRLDAFGNIAKGIIVSILSDVGGHRDPLQNSNRVSRGKRARRKAKRGGVYFYNRAKRGRLPRGIYNRIDSPLGSAVQSALFIVGSTIYKPRYKVFELARRVFDSTFTRRFPVNLALAIALRKK